MNKKLFIIATINIGITCLAQIFTWIFMNAVPQISLIDLLIVPFSLMLTNIVLWCSKLKLAFYQHALFAYTAFFISAILFLIITLSNSTQELPPGEIFLFADALFSFITTTIQLFILLLLHLLIFIVYKLSILWNSTN